MTGSRTLSSLELDLTPERFPFQFRGKKITISELGLFLKTKESAGNVIFNINLGVKDLGELDDTQALVQSLAGPLEFNSTGSPIAAVPFCKLENASIDVPKALVLAAAEGEIENLVKVEDIWIVCQYSAA